MGHNKEMNAIWRVSSKVCDWIVFKQMKRSQNQLKAFSIKRSLNKIILLVLIWFSSYSVVQSYS